jgi:hypothetical protein
MRETHRNYSYSEISFEEKPSIPKVPKGPKDPEDPKDPIPKERLCPKIQKSLKSC